MTLFFKFLCIFLLGNIAFLSLIFLLIYCYLAAKLTFRNLLLFVNFDKRSKECRVLTICKGSRNRSNNDHGALYLSMM